jgi:hypothetical protein
MCRLKFKNLTENQQFSYHSKLEGVGERMWVRAGEGADVAG